MAVTTVDIDKDLLAEAKRVLGVTTTKDVVDKALRDAVDRQRLLVGLNRLATLELDENPHKIAYDLG